MFPRIREDVNSVLERDPAARSWLEVMLCYPGLWAVWFHRVSHVLWRAKLRLPARMLSQVGRFFTGVDIHPDALIALSSRVEELEERLGAHVRTLEPFATEEAERIAYREELDRLQDYVSMGEGI